jgi:23S rRNA pseudouridine2605 synthase
VNGRVAVIGERVESSDVITLDGVLLAGSVDRAYLALHKPPGVVTTTRRHAGERSVMDLLPAEPRVYPVGRLDKESSGLLLLSNDGGWSNIVMHPRYGIEKEYDVVVSGRPGPDALQRMRSGVEIAPGVVTAPARVEAIEVDARAARLSVTVVEGKKRQIRLMAAAVGHPVLTLRRVRIGSIRLGDLAEGNWRALDDGEVESIGEHARRVAEVSARPPAEDRDRRSGRGR